MKLGKLALAPIAAAAMIAFSIPAVADTLYNINLGNASPGLGSWIGPYGTANVSLLDSTHASITFNSSQSSDGKYIYLMGDGGSAAVNVNASSWSFTGLTGTYLNSGFSGGSLEDGGAGNEDGFGSFNQTFNNGGGFTQARNQISFGLTNTSGTWADSDSVLIGNVKGYSVAMHGFACALQPDGCLAANGAAFTGFGVNGPTPPVPEPETYAMMLAGLGLLGFVARRRRQTLGNVVPA